jgi:hypothetical protein
MATAAAIRRRRAGRDVIKHSRGTDAACCIGGICDPQRLQGLRAPAPRGIPSSMCRGPASSSLATCPSRRDDRPHLRAAPDRRPERSRHLVCCRAQRGVPRAEPIRARPAGHGRDHRARALGSGPRCQRARDGGVLRPRRIRVNAICPGTIRTRLTADIVERVERATTEGRGIPVGRVGEPEDIARCALFLPPTMRRSSPAPTSWSTVARWPRRPSVAVAAPAPSVLDSVRPGDADRRSQS